MSSSEPTGPQSVNEPEPGEDKGSGEGEIASTEQALQGGTLVGRWRFNETSGQTVFGRFGTNNGFLGSTMNFDSNDPFRSSLNEPNEDALIGRSLFFRATGDNAPPNNDFVTVPFVGDDEDGPVPAAIDLRPQTVSVEAWIRTGSAPASAGYIVSKGIDVLAGDCSASSYYLYMDSSGHVRFGVTPIGIGGIGTRESPPSANLTNLVWHHLVGTYDGTKAGLFVDGNLVGYSTAGAAANVSYAAGKSRDLFFGAYNHPTRLDCKLGFNGRVDDVRIYTGALTQADVTQRFGGAPSPSNDADNDGIADSLDRCPNTSSGTAVSSRGCNCAQISAGVVLACPINGSQCYDSHSDYVSCVENKLDLLVPEGGGTLDCVEEIQDQADASNIGAPGDELNCDEF